ncbi:MAG: hypothetical protein ABL886_04630, partial [Rhodoglobus sp.]
MADAETELRMRMATALGLDPTTGTQQGTLRTVTAELQRSTTDNILNARRGYHASVRVEDAGRL